MPDDQGENLSSTTGGDSLGIDLQQLTVKELYDAFWNASENGPIGAVGILFIEIRRRGLPDPQPDAD